MFIINGQQYSRICKNREYVKIYYINIVLIGWGMILNLFLLLICTFDFSKIGVFWA